MSEIKQEQARAQNLEWCVGEGPASWHQKRAGHAFCGVTTGFSTREEAEQFASLCRSKHPTPRTFTVFQAVQP